MSRDFEDQVKDAKAAGPRSVMRLWMETLMDALRRAPREHVDVFARDGGYALRLLRRRRGFAVSAVLTLAVGIGLNTALFSVVSGVLLRKLPFPNSERLVRVYEMAPTETDGLEEVSEGSFVEWHAQTKMFSRLVAVDRTRDTLITGDRDPDEIAAIKVTDGFFNMLGTRPALGRLFNPEDFDGLRAGIAVEMAKPRRLREFPTPTTVVISHDLWMREFGGRPDVVGRRVRLGTTSVEVIGVLPEDFGLAAAAIWGQVDCWLPEVPVPGSRFVPTYRHLAVIGQMRTDITIDQARAELAGIAARLAVTRQAPSNTWTARMLPLLDTVTAGARLRLWFLFAAAACVLLIACANVASLLLAHASGRRLELATRSALGATRAQIVRQMLTEGLVLGVLGGLLGLLLAWWAVPVLVSLAPPDVPRLKEIAVDRWILGFALVISVLAGLACGVAGSVVPNRLFLRGSAHTSGASARRHSPRFRQVLTTVQVALAMLLVVGAGLLIRSVLALYEVDRGYKSERVVAVTFNPSFQRYQSLPAMSAFMTDLLQRITSLPGVVAAGAGTRPLAGLGMSNIVRTSPDAGEVRIGINAVTPGYLTALQATIMQGRAILDSDIASAPAIALVNASAARRLWGTTSPIGQRLFLDEDRRQLHVAGVVADVRQDLEKPAEPEIYLPQAQSTHAITSNVLIRTAGDPKAIVPAIRTLLHQADPDQPLTGVETLDERMATATAPRRFLVQLVGLFSFLAVGLAILGIYGVVAEFVAQRVPEIGVRVALGAPRAAIIRMVISQGIGLVILGIAAGVGAAVMLRQYMAAFLFGVPALDLPTYIIATLGLALGTLAACWIPARRAATVDPVRALRQE